MSCLVRGPSIRIDRESRQDQGAMSNQPTHDWMSRPNTRIQACLQGTFQSANLILDLLDSSLCFAVGGGFSDGALLGYGTGNKIIVFFTGASNLLQSCINKYL